MSTFFNADTHKETGSPGAKLDSSDTETQSQVQGLNSKPSSEKESTLVDEPLRDSMNGDGTNKEADSEESNKEVTPNTDTAKESVPNEDAKPEENKENNANEDSTEDKNDDAEYPSSWRLLLITIALCLCVFCVALVCAEMVDEA